MTKLVLAGGTDVAEMALFSLESFPQELSDNSTLSNLEAAGQALRMHTGADGGYLLHLYVNEDIPESVKKYCVLSDPIQYRFVTNSGQIGFGGVESTYAGFKANPNIRADAAIEPDTYNATAYRTSYPDDLVERRIEDRIGKGGMRAVSLPGEVFGISALVVLLLLIYGFNANLLALGAAAVVVASVVVWYKWYTKSDNYQSFLTQKLEVEYEYPSIVIAMVSATESRC